MSRPTPAVLAMSGRGELPYALLHRVPLFLHALRALAASGDHVLLVVVDQDDRERVTHEVRRAGIEADVRAGDDWWQRVHEVGIGTTGLLVHDALCPLTSTGFIRAVRRSAAEQSEASWLAYRPVTDTVKTVVDERIQATIDREQLAALVSPVVVSAEVLSGAVASGEPPPVEDFARLADWLRHRGQVRLLRAPSLARRVDDASAVNLLECVDEIARTVRRGPGARGDVAVTDAAGPGIP